MANLKLHGGIVILLAIPTLATVGATIRNVRYQSEMESLPDHPSKQAGLQQIRIQSQGQTQTYSLYVPSSLNLNQPAPLVMVLHGAGGQGKLYIERNNWKSEADREGFIVVAPDGLPVRIHAAPKFLTNPRVWASGQIKPFTPRGRLDDNRFLNDVLDQVEHNFLIDKKRVYVCGHSNGSSMTFRFANHSAARVTAIAMVAGEMNEERPNPTRDVPTLYFLGDQDPLTLLKGGRRTTPWGTHDVPDIRIGLSSWARAIHASPTPVIRTDDNVKTVFDYGPNMTMWLIKGQGHMWPGGTEAGLPARAVGPSVRTVDATHEFWEFFKAHPMSK